MTRILMLLDNPYTNDRRVQREAETLAAAGYDITMVCNTKEGEAIDEVVNGVTIHRHFMHSRIFDIKDKSYAPELAKYLVDKFEFDILHTHDREMLHVASYIHKIKSNFKYIHDIHEMHFSFPVITDSKSWIVKLKSWIVHRMRVNREQKDMSVVKDFITVNQSLEENLRRHYSLPIEGIVIRNTPELIPSPAKSNIIRDYFKISNDTKILVFIGSNIYRNALNLEQVMDEVSNQANLALVYICSDNNNKKAVEAWATERSYSNIYFHPLLHPNDIPRYLSSCDVGLVPTWNKKNLSYWYALDNKLFEYMMSEIPILATAQPEYITIIDKYKMGECVNPDNKNAYIDGLKKILGNYEYYKNNTLKAKLENNWEIESQKLLSLYTSVLKK
jgi:glycosyltransferase involved in cell wall biosynthesis